LGIGTAALVRADPRNPVYAAYLGGATATRAGDAWMPWFFGASRAAVASASPNAARFAALTEAHLP